MSDSSWLPSLPEWIPFPRVVWFVLEGIGLAIVGLSLRELLEPATAAVMIGNVAFFVGATTALLGAVAFLVLVTVNR